MDVAFLMKIRYNRNMKKCRKMLGDIHDEILVELMALIETQRKKTLAFWALSLVEKECLDVYEKKHDSFYRDEMKNLRLLIENEDTKAIKACVKRARNEIVKDEFLEEIATRAMTSAMNVYVTPTCALGFTFYLVALRVYLKFGLNECQEVYDEKAHLEYEILLDSLKDVCIADEKSPVKVKWNC